ncbi:MAG: triose-phosphate isomerase family protein [Verrucomicrobiota bacterium]
MPKRICIAVANWKMAMTLHQCRVFARNFEQEMGDLLGKIQVILCAPATAMSTLAEAVKDLPMVDPGAQNSSAFPDPEHSGEISAALLADAGCVWCMVGHWEMKVRMNKADDELNRELHAVFNNGMRPIILVGESETDKGTPANDLVERMETMLDGITAEQITKALMVYEPEWAIGADEPAPPEYIAERATFMRYWLIDRYGEDAIQPIPIIYGGAVFPENAEWLLSTPDIDGLGAGRKSRDAKEFASIAKIVGKAFDLI